MDYITTTNLRTQSSNLVNALKKGESVSLIHRSKIVAVIKPVQEEKKVFNLEEFNRILDAVRPKKILPRSQREKVYRKHLTQKYGKNLS